MDRDYRQSYPAPAEALVLEVARGVIEVANGAEGSAVEFAVHQRLQRVKPGSGGLVERITPDLVPKDFDYDKVFARMARVTRRTGSRCGWRSRIRGRWSSTGIPRSRWSSR